MRRESTGAIRAITATLARMARAKQDGAAVAEYVATAEFMSWFARVDPQHRMSIMQLVVKARGEARAMKPIPAAGTKKTSWQGTDAPERYRKAWARHHGNIERVAAELRMTIGAVKRARSRYLPDYVSPKSKTVDTSEKRV